MNIDATLWLHCRINGQPAPDGAEAPFIAEVRRIAYIAVHGSAPLMPIADDAAQNFLGRMVEGRWPDSWRGIDLHWLAGKVDKMVTRTVLDLVAEEWHEERRPSVPVCYSVQQQYHRLVAEVEVETGHGPRTVLLKAPVVPDDDEAVDTEVGHMTSAAVERAAPVPAALMAVRRALSSEKFYRCDAPRIIEAAVLRWLARNPTHCSRAAVAAALGLTESTARRLQCRARRASGPEAAVSAKAKKRLESRVQRKIEKVLK